jgi:hypothetical protein
MDRQGGYPLLNCKAFVDNLQIVGIFTVLEAAVNAKAVNPGLI